MSLRLIGVDVDDIARLHAVHEHAFRVERPIGQHGTEWAESCFPAPFDHLCDFRFCTTSGSALDSHRFRGKYAACDLAVVRVRHGDHVPAIYGGAGWWFVDKRAILGR